MEGVFEHFNMPVGEKKQIGVATISTFEFSRKADPIFAIRAAMDGMAIYDGKYVRLHVDGVLMMSDTQMEKSSNYTFCKKANGHVLIAGLGIGLIVKNILPKLKDGTITKVTIIEKYQDVIDLVSPYFTDDNIEVICSDIFDYEPPKGIKYDTVYFDIWPEITQDNLEEIKLLHNRYKNKINRSNPNHFMNSWMKEYLQNQKRRESRYSYGW